MTPPAVVGPAAPADVAAIVALEAECFPLDPWSVNLIGEAVSGTLPTISVLVAHDGDDAPAFAGYAVLSVVDVDAELQRIAVAADRRRGGVATALLDAGRELARAGGATRLLLEVREDNEPALGFYEAHGFAELGRRARYYRDGTTAVVLTLDLADHPTYQQGE